MALAGESGKNCDTPESERYLEFLLGEDMKQRAIFYWN